MTAPTITYGHGKLEDAWNTLATDYTLSLNGSTGTATVTSGHDLAVNLTVFVADAYEKNDDNFNVSTITHPTIIFRYKTSGSATAKVIAEFSDASTQTLLAETASSTWKIVTATLTDVKTLDHLIFYCCDNTGTVTYDFFLVCKGTFTFPQYTRVNWDMMNRYSNTEIPSRLGRRKAWMGANETIIMLDGDVDSNRASWKRTLDTNPAQVLEDIHHNAYAEAWQWLTTDRAAFKAVLEHLTITEVPTQDYLYSFSAALSEYRLSKAQDETLKERFQIA